MKLGRYDLGDVIGKGGMGTVYRAVDRETGQPVAVKVLSPRAAVNRVARRRLEQEHAAARLLQHPNIVRGLDAGAENGTYYLVMELVEGESLTRRVCESGPLSLGEARRLLGQVADALDYAHGQGLIHRDVKPDNVLITREGQAKLTDLGLVKDLSTGEALTKSGTWLGTIGYMAPEQFGDARHADSACDVYGLAATLYYALTGSSPFHGGNLTVLGKKLKGDFAPPSALVRALPARVDEAMAVALAPTPQSRPASCQALIARLPAAPAAGRSRAGTGGRSAQGLGAPGAFDPNERRRAVRYPARRSGSCRALRGGANRWVIEILDVSKTGLLAQVNRRFEPGTVLELEVMDEASGFPATFLMRACWAREMTPRTWAIGCAFGRALDEEDLAVFLGDKAGTVVVLPAS